MKRVVAPPNPPSENGSAPYFVRLNDGSRVEILSAARAAAAQDLPDTDAREPDDVEEAIEREHRRQARAALEEARNQISDQTRAFHRLEQGLPTPQDLTTHVKGAEAAIEREEAQTHELVELSREQSRRHRDLLHLRGVHGLVRAAVYPVSRVKHFAMLAPVLLVESAANASFFAASNTHGVGGGFGVALFVSFTNVVLGAASGYFCFRRRHADRRLERLATTGIVVYVLLAIFFNWAVARFRDESINGAHAQGLLELLKPSGGTSLASAALFLIGLLASAISCWKGYKADDATPGHGDRDRRFRRADRALRDGRDRHHQALVGHAESGLENCRAALRRAGEDLDQMREIIARLERVAEHYDVARGTAERWRTLWLKRYRTEVIRGRTSPPPSYFNHYPPFPNELDTTAVHHLRDRLEVSARRLEELKAAALRIERGHPERIQHAHETFKRHWSDVTRRANARYGDSGGHDLAPPSTEVVNG